MYGVMIHKVRVNGPLYHDIVTDKDLIADILPPPQYIIESYLVALQIANALVHQADDRLDVPSSEVLKGRTIPLLRSDHECRVGCRIRRATLSGCHEVRRR